MQGKRGGASEERNEREERSEERRGEKARGLRVEEDDRGGGCALRKKAKGGHGAR